MIALVILVAVLLAFTSQSLRSYQKANEDNDKRQQILRSINVSVPANEAEAKYNELIDKAIVEKHEGKRRLLLTLLLRQSFECDTLRTDFIDFCLETIQSSYESYANRALCMKLAYEQCKFFPELLSELSNCLEIISTEPLSSGLKTAKRNVMKKILLTNIKMSVD